MKVAAEKLELGAVCKLTASLCRPRYCREIVVDEPVPVTEPLIGGSPAIAAARSMAASAIASGVSVLIYGEYGVGKRHLAQTICASVAAPSASVDCESVAASAVRQEIESGLGVASGSRGHESRRPIAGTVVLVHVDRCKPETQTALMRVLDGRFRQPGTDTLPVQVISTCRADPKLLARSGSFHPDLFFSIAVVKIGLPPLRDRKDDIPLLANHLLNQLARSTGRPSMHIDRQAMEKLIQHQWPGNITELKNVIQRSAALAASSAIDTVVMLDHAIPNQSPGTKLAERCRPPGGLDEYLATVERDCLAAALAETRGNLTKAAELLGIPFRSIRYRLKKLGMSRFAPDPGDGR